MMNAVKETEPLQMPEEDKIIPSEKWERREVTKSFMVDSEMMEQHRQRPGDPQNPTPSADRDQRGIWPGGGRPGAKGRCNYGTGKELSASGD